MSENLELGIAPDPFDRSLLRLDPSYAETIGVKKQLTTVPVRKPTRHEFVRVHPKPEYRLTAAIIELKDDRETYILTPEIAHQLPDEFTPAILFTTLNRQGVLFLWPVKLPGLDGKENAWHRSAREAAEKAMSEWVRVGSNMPWVLTIFTSLRASCLSLIGPTSPLPRSSVSPFASATLTRWITPC